MIALVRYQLAVLGHSQRYLVPVLLYLGMLAVLNSDNAGPELPVFVVTAGALLVVAGWLTIALINVDDQVQHAVTRIHVGSLWRILVGTVITVLLCSVALGVLSVAWTVITHHGARYPISDLVVGLGAHIVCACVGITVALPCSGLLIQRIGYTVISATALFILVLLVKPIPLVYPLLAAMGRDSLPPALLLRTAITALFAVTASCSLVMTLCARRG